VFERITWNPDICGGEACIRGMRMPVQTVLKLLAGGMEHTEILAEYPYLEEADIQASLEYGAWLASERVLPAAAST
jgi:uncharacterized protein (DUF433 family)